MMERCSEFSLKVRTFSLPHLSVLTCLPSFLPSFIRSFNTEHYLYLLRICCESDSLFCSFVLYSFPLTSLFLIFPVPHTPHHTTSHRITSVSGNLTSMMTQGRIQPDEMCVGAMYKQFRQVQLSTSLCELANIFDRSVRNNLGMQEVAGSISGE